MWGEQGNRLIKKSWGGFWIQLQGLQSKLDKKKTEKQKSAWFHVQDSLKLIAWLKQRLILC